MSRLRGEGAVAAAFLVSIAGALGLAVVYVAGGQTQLEGVFLALALGGIGVGLVSFAKRFLPTEEETEEREPLASTEEEVAAFTRDFEAGEEVIQRRGLLVKLGLGALGALGLAALFPVRSLGPRPGRGLKETSFAEAAGTPVRVVTEDGAPVAARSVRVGSLATVWPEGRVQDADAPTLLIRLEDEVLDELGETREGMVGGIVAFSKLCTHTGCPVGLYQQEEKLLLCPCHQSTFDVLDGARPVFGPATRPLPQLPLGEDDEGYLVATGDFEAPVGGGFWDRGR